MANLAKAGWPREYVRELIQRSQAGDMDAREQLVGANLGLVGHVAKRFQVTGYDYEELFQVGCIGLVKAIHGFDLAYDVRFATYAVPRILGEIGHFVRDSNRGAHIGRGQRQLAAHVRQVAEMLTMMLEREPTLGEIAQFMSEPEAKLATALLSVSTTVALEQQIQGTKGSSLRIMDMVAGADRVEESVTTKLTVEQALAALPPLEREVINLRYGERVTQTQIARRVQQSQAQVSRIEHRALKRMRTWLEQSQNPRSGG